MKLKVDFSSVPTIEKGTEVLLSSSGPATRIFNVATTDQIGELFSYTFSASIESRGTVLILTGWYQPNPANSAFWALGELRLS